MLLCLWLFLFSRAYVVVPVSLSVSAVASVHVTTSVSVSVSVCVSSCFLCCRWFVLGRSVFWVCLCFMVLSLVLLGSPNHPTFTELCTCPLYNGFEIRTTLLF